VVCALFNIIIFIVTYLTLNFSFTDDGWSTEAYEELENLTRERMLQAQAMAYSLEGIPLVYLFQMDPTADEALINRQLVNRGVAQWVEPNLPSN